MRRWAPTILVFALLAGTALAFATTERQKLEASPFAVLHVTPRDLSPARGSATIVLRLQHPHLVTVEILNASEHTVAVLARDKRFERGKLKLRWNASGAPDGIYTPRVTLDQSRVFTLPDHIRIDTVPPRVKLVSYTPHVIRRRKKARVRIVYAVSEAAHVMLYVNGIRQLVGFSKATHSHVDWRRRRLRPGRYRLQLAAVDLAGNISTRTAPFVVRVR